MPGQDWRQYGEEEVAGLTLLTWIRTHTLGFLFSLSRSAADQEEEGSLLQFERSAERESWTGLGRGCCGQPAPLRPAAGPGSLGPVYLSVHRRCAQLGVSESPWLCISGTLAGPCICAARTHWRPGCDLWDSAPIFGILIPSTQEKTI